MNRGLTLAGLFLILLLSNAFSKKNNVYFTSDDSKNWEYIIKDKKIIPSTLFIMEYGILKITEVSTGYLRTKKTHSNFTLTVDWRWTKVPANSGVLIHIQPKDTIWPACYQVQQKAQSAGDIICMNGLWAKESADTVKFTIPKIKPSNEKPAGEWNSMKIISKNGNLTVLINDEIQNKITGMTAKKGFIGFQAEGKPVEFKNLKIK